MTKRRTEITVETERLLVAQRQLTRVWCVRCGLEVETAAETEQESTGGTAQGAGSGQAGADAARGGRKSGNSSQGS